MKSLDGKMLACGCRCFAGQRFRTAIYNNTEEAEKAVGVVLCYKKMINLINLSWVVYKILKHLKIADYITRDVPLLGIGQCFNVSLRQLVTTKNRLAGNQ